MLISERTVRDVQDLRDRLRGDVVGPADTAWDQARQAWNLAVDQRPALVAFPEDADDVVAIVDYAREYGLRVAPQGTGHNAGPLGVARRHRAAEHGADARRRDRRRRPARPRRPPARCGSRSPRPRPSTASPRWPAPRPTSASSATASAAA